MLAHRRFGVAIAAVGSFGLLGLPAQAQTTTVDTIAEQVAEAAPDQGAIVALDGPGSTIVAGHEVDLPQEATEPMVIAGMSVALPSEVASSNAEASADGSLVFEGESGSADVVVQLLEDGSTRVQTVSASAREGVRFTYDLGTDAEITRAEDGKYYGGAVVDGVVKVVEIDAPWAVDAAGRAVPTHYETEGGSLTQVIEPDAATIFPVVADPKFKRYGAAYSAKFNKAETRDLAGAGGATGTCAALVKVNPAAVAVCGAVGAYLFTQASIANGRGECVAMTIVPPGLVLRYDDGDCA